MEIVPPKLTLIGYWAPTDAEAGNPWPAVSSFVDSRWDADERVLVADYLSQGQTIRLCMGFSPCRLCGKENGSLELTDGVFVWPEGLAHYLREHDVRLPDRFVRHVEEAMDALEEARHDENWWRSQRLL